MAVNILAIVQARMNSTRLPGKVLKKVNGLTLIEVLLQRLSQSTFIDKIILATGESASNRALVEEGTQLGYEVFCGSEEDVLERFYQAAKSQRAKTVVRITGDCPLIDPTLTDEVIQLYQDQDVDYASNTDPPSYPDGLDVEVFSFSVLERAQKQATTKYEREHVTPFICNHKEMKRLNLASEKNYASERWTVDNPEDLTVVANVIDHFKPNVHFSWKEVIKLKAPHPEYFLPNKGIQRNEGAVLGTGQKLYMRAKKVIPGGTMLLSKRPEIFLPEQWPSYFSKAKGCRVWDLDDREYIDLSIMGIGTNTLGYGRDEVDDAVRRVIDKGNLSTLNSAEEVELAEKLIALHPWADMARFARSGGEANAIAIRIARASTGKDKVAICGYHGWHDWYLSANLGQNSSLDGHLLPGLEPRGVPRGLVGTTLPFPYNDIESLEKLIRENDIGVIKMEVTRSTTPKQGYLEAVRKLATENKILLIFDECTSGFRETFGGLHKKYGVEPDLMMLGKTLGNGYAISAVIGKKEIMKEAERSFISSTFWTERIGSAAALKALEVMEREESWDQITAMGKVIGQRWLELGNKYQLPIEIGGIPALVNFTIQVDDWLKYKTLITQEMLKKGYLAANAVYVCTEHSETIVNDYFDQIDPVFSLIAQCENDRNIDDLLNGPICHTGFGRLNG